MSQGGYQEEISEKCQLFDMLPIVSDALKRETCEHGFISI